MDISATITNVTSRQVTRKKDGQAITIFEITDATNTTWTTNRRDIANKAHSLIGQPATIVGRTEQNGTYINNYIDDILAGASQGFQPPQQTTHTGFLPETPAPVLPNQPIESKDHMIWRQTAAKVSAHLSGTALEFWANVDDLVKYFESGTKPTPVTSNAAPASPQAQQPVPVATAVEAFQGDDDIPF